jgi:hypothetical protein
VPHVWRNPSEDEELRIVPELRPVLHMEVLLKVGFEIARDLKTEKKGIPKHLLRMMVLANEAKDDFYFTEASRPVRKTVSASLGCSLTPASGWGTVVSSRDLSAPHHSTSFQISGCSSPSSPTSAKISTARSRCVMDSSRRPAACSRSARLLCNAASR